MSNRIARSLRRDVRFSRPPPVTDWLEENIVLPPEFAPKNPGPFRVKGRPFQRRILECFHPESGVRRCVFTAAAQGGGKTAVMMGGIAYRMKFAPMPGMLMGPSIEWTKEKLVTERLHPLINENPILAELKPDNPDNFKNALMMMKGGAWNVVGANSSTALAGGTKGIVAIDEAAKIEHIVREDAPEAHPILNAFERTGDYSGMEFQWLSATPNTANHQFWKLYLEGDQTHPFVKCPHCNGDYFGLEFEQEEGKEFTEESQGDAKPDHYRSVIWSPDARNRDGSWNKSKVIQTAHYVCPANGCKITDKELAAMVQKFEEFRKNPEAPSTNRSFRVNAFYAPGRRIGDIALKFTERGDSSTSGLQAFWNSWLVLPFSAFDYNIKDEHIFALCGDYARGTLPFKPALLFLNVDPGEIQTHWTVTAADHSGSLFLIDWGTVLTSRDLLKPEFLRCRRYPIAGTADTHGPTSGFIDSGWQTEEQYQVCMASGRYFTPTKGSPAKAGTWSKGQIQAWPGMELVTYVDTQAKDNLYGKRIARRGNPGLTLPSNIDGDLVQGLSGQQKDKHTGQWKKVAHDHYGDCIKGAVVATWVNHSLLDRLRKASQHKPTA